MYTLVYTKEYLKLANRFVKRHPDLKSRYDKTLRLLTANPHHPSLRLHALGGTHQGLHSVSINLSYRITLELQITDKEIILIKVGDHQTVY
jgi:mRNA-degrading endonuclease YafQ of YafQ-DinJ toxin-antitoxin module